MALYDDLKHLPDVWKKAPPIAKTWIAVSTFLAITPIAELSSTIIKWKGFFKEALAFYQTYYLKPVSEFFKNWNIEIPHELINSWTLFILIVGAYLKGIQLYAAQAIAGDSMPSFLVRRYMDQHYKKPRMTEALFLMTTSLIAIFCLHITDSIVIGTVLTAFIIQLAISNSLLPFLLSVVSFSVPVIVVGLFAAVQKGIYG